jgi:uncharacterized protein YfaA (DUF2138 family)
MKHMFDTLPFTVDIPFAAEDVTIHADYESLIARKLLRQLVDSAREVAADMSSACSAGDVWRWLASPSFVTELRELRKLAGDTVSDADQETTLLGVRIDITDRRVPGGCVPVITRATASSDVVSVTGVAPR